MKMKSCLEQWNVLTIVSSMLILVRLKPSYQNKDQIPGEVFQSHDRIDVYVYKVEDNGRGVNVL